MIRLGRRALLAFGVLTLVLVGLWMWQSWKNLQDLQLQRMTIAAALAAHHSKSYFDTVGSHLESLASIKTYKPPACLLINRNAVIY